MKPAGPRAAADRACAHPRHHPLLPLLVLLTAGIAALAASCGGDASSPVRSPADSSAPPGATVPIDLPRADSLYRDGYFEDAIAIYSAAAANGNDGQRTQALWSLGRIQYQRGEYKDAGDSLQALLKQPVTPEQQRQAHLLLGIAAAGRGDNQQARNALQSYLDSKGPAAAYARLHLADVDGREGKLDDAVQQVQAALAAHLPPAADTHARFDLAGYYDPAGRVKDAVAVYQALSTDAPVESDRAEALWQLAQLAETSGDKQLASQSLQTLAQKYPGQQRALGALSDPMLAGSTVAARDRALVLLRNRSNGPATDAWKAFAASPDPGASGEAHYYLGILAERAGTPDAALTEYGQAIALLGQAGNAALRGQAYWDQATVLDAAGRADEAVQSYVSAADLAPGIPGAPDGIFRAGLLRLEQNRPGDAAALWQRYLTLNTSAHARARGDFWLAKADEATGETAAARATLQSAATASPLTYYGLRAQALLTGQTATPNAASAQPPAPDWTATEDAIGLSAGQEDAIAREALFKETAWQRGIELLHAGLDTDAQGEFQDLIDRSASDPWLLYRLARALSDEGLTSLAARAATDLVALLPQPPRAVLALAYPAPYLDLATKAARDGSVSPLLLFALVRQESMFDPSAVSGAGAMGLTQVMPGTAEGIARDLQETDFQDDDLLRPAVSLRFGAHYLGAQVKRFDGDLGAALAAYNGGPGNAARWRQPSHGDPDLFLESIDFSETRSYVELVLQNYAMYQYAYSAQPHPLLAR